MEALVILGIILLLITLIGHGIWELVAWMFRGFQPRRKVVQQVFPPTPIIDERLITRRTLQKLINRGLLERSVWTEVERAIAEMNAVPVSRPAAIPVATVHVPAPPVSPAPTASHAQAVAEAPAPAAPVSLDRPAPVVVPPPVPPTLRPVPAPAPVRHRPLGEMLKAFMEERNIRWGELIGGMLIVGCSIALVISLWAEISQRPMLKVGVFTGVVAGLFGLGLYADRKWKLPATSWGILLTATLMVPLHLAAMVVIGGQEQANAMAMGVQLLAVAALGVLTWLAAGVIARGWRMLVAGAVLVLSNIGPAMYVTGAIRANDLTHAMAAMAAIVGLFIAAGGAAIYQIRRRTIWQPHHVREAICALLLPLFAAVPSLMMNAHANAHLPSYWRAAGPILALLAAPLLLAAGQIAARAGDVVRPWRTGLTIGQLMVICGLLACIGLSWGMPLTLLIASLVVAAILGGSGYLHRDPVQLVVGLLAIVVAYGAAMPVVAGRVGWTDLGHPFWTAHIGMEMLPAVLLTAGCAWVVRRRERTAGVLGYAIAAGIAVLALLQVLGAVYLTDTPIRGAWLLFAGYAVASLVAAILLRSRGIAAIATALAICAVQQFGLGDGSGWLLASLGISTAWAICAAAGRWLPRRFEFVTRTLAIDGAWWTGAAAAVLLAGQFHQIPLQSAAGYAWAITAVFALLLVGRGTALDFAAVQVALSGAVCLQLLSFVPHQPIARKVVDCCVALLALQGMWSALRLLLPRAGQKATFLQPAISVDRVLGGVAAAGAVLIALTCLLDAGHYELLASAQHTNSITQLMLGSSYPGLWLTMLLAISVSVLETALGKRQWLFVTVGTIYALAWVVAARTWPDMAASGVRLASLAVLLAMSIPIWLRLRVVQDVRLRGLAIALGALPLVGLTLAASAASLQGIGPVTPTAGSIFSAMGAFGSYVIPMLILAAILAVHAARNRSQAMAVLSAAVLNLTVTLAYLLQFGVSTPVDLLQLVQANAIATGAFACVWAILFRCLAEERDTLPGGLCALAAACMVVATQLAGLAQTAIWGFGYLPLSLTEVGTLAMLWVVTGLSAALCWLLWPAWARINGIPAAILLATTALAATFSGVSTWTAFHIVLAGYVLAGWAAGMVRLYALRATVEEPGVTVGDHEITYARPDTQWIHDTLRATLTWGTALALGILVFSCRAMLGDPQSPWWSIGALVSMASLWVVLAQAELAPGYLYAVTAAISLAVTFLWGSRFWQFSPHGVRDLVMLNVLTLAGCGLASLVLELQVFAKAAGRVRHVLPPLHIVAGSSSVVVLLVTSIFQITSMPSLVASTNSMLIAGAAAIAVVGLLIACLWDHTMRLAARLLYAAGFAVIALVMDISGLRTSELTQVSLITGVGLTILWATLLHRWEEIRTYAARLGAAIWPEPGLMQANAWFGLGLLAGILAHEAFLAQSLGRAPMPLWLIIILGLLLLLLAAELIAVALGAVVDVVSLPFTRRETYVYLAEAVIGILCIHIRLTCPELFTGFLLQYWPAIAMAIAFAMAGLAEALQRKGIKVIAGPVGQTAFLIPLAPALLSGAMHTQVDYGLTLLLVGSYYIGLAIVRRSIPAGILGTIALNGAFWSVLWDYQSLRPDLHPQLWLIPPCLCVMLGTWLGRDRIDPKQAGALRYAALIIAYASSTADIALIGVANAPWLAGVLGLLSVLGVLAGILFRIRSFLYAGTAFLAVAILTLIYHATANLHQTWLLWLCGIGLGVAILMAFAMFERHREKLGDAIDQLRQWEA